MTGHQSQKSLQDVYGCPVTANAKIGEKTNGQCPITTPKN